MEHTRADGTVGRRVRPDVIDLGWGNGAFRNNQRTEPQRCHQLKEKDVLRIGFSSRECDLLHETSDCTGLRSKDDDDEKEEV
ncbi:hypothetical protein DUI87_32069 [Hirundo rustica rustica]|uniref:FHA domain-containing protein n=1 Tax=Hirundo rustica rustica TaxID=333673 RepID=A0A3M0IUD8_HIRRU|nr:hypothetical protein DUI87_32069 [Hirundo rustica rustica]